MHGYTGDFLPVASEHESYSVRPGWMSRKHELSHLTAVVTCANKDNSHPSIDVFWMKHASIASIKIDIV